MAPATVISLVVAPERRHARRQPAGLSTGHPYGSHPSPISGSSRCWVAEKRDQLARHDLGFVLDEKMASGQSATADPLRPRAPDLQDVRVKAWQRTVRAPQREQWAFDPASAEVGLIVLPINRGAGPVVLAHRFDRACVIQ